MAITITCDYSKYGLIVVNAVNGGLETRATYGLFVALNPTNVPETDSLLDTGIFGQLGNTFSGSSITSSSLSFYDRNTALFGLSGSNTYVAVIAKQSDDGWVVQEAVLENFTITKEYQSFSGGSFDIDKGISYIVGDVAKPTVGKFVFSVYSVPFSAVDSRTVVSGSSFYVDYTSDQLSLGDVIITKRGTLNTDGLAGDALTGYIAADNFPTKSDITFIGTVSYEYGNGLYTPELIIGAFDMITPSVLPFDGSMEAVDYLVIDHSNLIANSQNSGGSFTLPSAYFNAPKKNDMYLANILIQSKVDIETGEGKALFESALSDSDVEKYAIVAKAKVDGENLKADYASYHVSMAGTLHMRFEDAGLEEITGLVHRPLLGIGFFDLKDGFPLDSVNGFVENPFVRNADNEEDVLSTVTLRYSLDGGEYVTDLNDIIAQIETTGQYRLYINGRKNEEGYEDYNRTVLLNIEKKALTFNESANLSVPPIVQYSSNLRRDIDGVLDANEVFTGAVYDYLPAVRAVVIYNAEDVNDETIDESGKSGVDVTIEFRFDDDDVNSINNDLYELPPLWSLPCGVVQMWTGELSIPCSALSLPEPIVYGTVANEGAVNVEVNLGRIGGISERFEDITITCTGSFNWETLEVNLNHESYDLGGLDVGHYVVGDVAGESYCTSIINPNITKASLTIDETELNADADGFAISQFDVAAEGETKEVEFYLPASAITGWQYEDGDLFTNSSVEAESGTRPLFWIKAKAIYDWNASENKVNDEYSYEDGSPTVSVAIIGKSSDLVARYNIATSLPLSATGMVEGFSRYSLDVSDVVWSNLFNLTYGDTSGTLVTQVNSNLINVYDSNNTYLETLDELEHNGIAVNAEVWATCTWDGSLSGGEDAEVTITFEIRNSDAKLFEGIDNVSTTLMVQEKALSAVLEPDYVPTIDAGVTGEGLVVDISSHLTLDGVVSGDDVGFGIATFTFENSNNATLRPIEYTTNAYIVLSGEDAGNYSLGVVTITGLINGLNGIALEIPRDAINTDGTIPSITYGDSVDSLEFHLPVDRNNVGISGWLEGDEAGVSSVDSIQAVCKYVAGQSEGTDKQVRVTGFEVTYLDGVDSSEYMYDPQLVGDDIFEIGTINKRQLTIDVTHATIPSIQAGAEGDDLVVQVSGAAIGNIVGSDEISANVTATYPNSNNDGTTDKMIDVPIQITISGADSGNYLPPVTSGKTVRGKILASGSGPAVATVWYTGIIPKVYIETDGVTNWHTNPYATNINDLAVLNDANSDGVSDDGKDIQTIINGLSGKTLYSGTRSASNASSLTLTFGYNDADWETALNNSGVIEEVREEFDMYEGYPFILTNQGDSFVVKNANTETMSFSKILANVVVDGVTLSGYLRTEVEAGDGFVGMYLEF